MLDELILIGIIILLVVLAVPAAIAMLFIRTSGLTDRITRLERLVGDQARKLATFAVPVPQDASTAASAAVVEPAAAAIVLPDPPSGADDTAAANVVPDALAASTDQPSESQPSDSQPSSAWDRALGKSPAAAASTGASFRRTGEDGPEARATARATAGATAGAAAQSATIAPSRIDALITWLQTNWIYAISAASLGLAGIFFVQYGMEKGLLPPAFRVLMGIAFGGALVAAGEWLRRRHGDEGDTATLYLPSVFSGAGLVSIFAATLAARHMYGLISPEVAFAGHLFTAALAVALGWFYGPLLAAVGLIGAGLSPFIVAGGSDAQPWLYAYFVLIAAVGLAIDAVRSWRWVSTLALVIGYAGAFLSFAGEAGAIGFAITMVTLALMSMAIPKLSLTPLHAAPCTLQSLLGQSAGSWPAFHTRLAIGAAFASTAFLLLMAFVPAAHSPLLAPASLAVLTLACLIWARRAEGLSDLALLPSIAFLAMLALHATGSHAFRAYLGFANKEGPMPLDMVNFIPMVVLMALAMNAAAIWRALRQQDRLFDLMFGLMAVLIAPLTIAILELLWAPAPTVGLPLWATLIIATAALMTWLATRFAAVDKGDMRRTAYATLSALSLIALALFLITTATALTLALAVLVVTAATLDRRFNLPEMGLFQQIGVAVLTYRLLIDPGLDYAMDAPIAPVLIAFAGSIAALVAARRIIPARPLTRAVLESAAAGLSAIFANVLIARLILPDAAEPYATHWWLSLQAMPWLILMLAQFYRTQTSDTMRSLRIGLAILSGAIAAVVMFFAVMPFNPLFAWDPTQTSGLVQGTIILNSLLLAYGLPGITLLAARHFMPALDPRLRLGILGTGTALLALNAALEIRFWFQGPFLGEPGVTQGELYTYTLALMALGAGLLFAAIRKGSSPLRRMAMAVIGIVIAKVFLVDAAGLTGLTRVFSFLGLGLSLAGLAWLNRWAERAAKAQ